MSLPKGRPQMKVYFSDFFEVDPAILEEYGAFNVSLINDLPLFVDPFLLFNSRKRHYIELHNNIIKYVRFLKEMSVGGAINHGLLTNWFVFKEVKQNWLGFSKEGNEGSGLGMTFAKALHRNLKIVFTDFGEETLTRGSHLEKLCLIKEGVGRDNISDFTTNLIKEYLLDYTQTFSQKHIKEEYLRRKTVGRVRFNYSSRTWESETYKLPFFALKNDYVLLTPRDILTKDESWINRPDLIHNIEEIAEAIPNEQLRGQISQYLIRNIPEDANKKEQREVATALLEKYPVILDYYIRKQEEDGDRASKVSREKVLMSEILYITQILELINNYLLPIGFYENRGETYVEAYERVMFLKDVIENKGGHKIFYVKGEPINKEDDLHILYRLTWYASPSDVGQEANDGRGPVDFKISRGNKDKTLVEFKLSSNKKLKQNLEKQVEIYEKASDPTNPSIKVILHFSEKEHERVKKVLKELNLEGDKNIVLIDAGKENKPSGSNA